MRLGLVKPINWIRCLTFYGHLRYATRFSVNRTTYHILVGWREGEANVSSEESQRFAAARQFFIDQGFMNIQAEWYAPGATELPDLIRLFVYWEDPDTSPSYEQLRIWGTEATTRKVEKAN